MDLMTKIKYVKTTTYFVRHSQCNLLKKRNLDITTEDIASEVAIQMVLE